MLSHFSCVSRGERLCSYFLLSISQSRTNARSFRRLINQFGTKNRSRKSESRMKEFQNQYYINNGEEQRLALRPIHASELWNRRRNNNNVMASSIGSNRTNEDQRSGRRQQAQHHQQRNDYGGDGSESGDDDENSPRDTNSHSPANYAPINEELEARLQELAAKMGYRVFKENGQRKFCAPIESKPPPRGTEVFVGKLPRDIYEDDLMPLFAQCGEIYEMRLMMDFSGTNRGYAFVTYTTREQARTACQRLNNFEIRRGRHIGVVSSVDNCRLFVGGIPRTRTREEVKGEMSKMTEGVMDVILYPSAADKTKNRGFAFVEYESHRAAAKARRKLLPNRIQLWGSVIAVDWAEPEQEVDEATMANVKILYVRNLMVHTSEETLMRAFEQAADAPSSVDRVKKMRDYAFVHFHTREQAMRAREHMNGAELDGAVIEVVWSKPPYPNNFVRSLKNLQKSSGAAVRSGQAGSNLNGQQQADDYMNAALRQMYGQAPTHINLLTGAGVTLPPATIASLDPTAAIQMQTPIFPTTPQSTPVAAFTGFPCIDLYGSNGQNGNDRQNSMANSNGGNSIKYISSHAMPNANMMSPMHAVPVAVPNSRMNRGAAGMRSAGFQAMINNTLRNTAANRRKFSEQFLYDYMMGQQNQQASLHQFHQQQQQLLAAQQQAAALLSPTASAPGGVLIWSGGAGPVWRPAVTSPTGFVPLSSAGAMAPPAPIPSLVSGMGGIGGGGGGEGGDNSSTANSNNSSDDSPPQSAGLCQGPPNAAQLLSGPQVLCFGNGTFPVASFQQHLAELCRDQGYGIPQYERAEIVQKDGGPTAYAYKVTVPALVAAIGAFQCSRYSTNDNEAREMAAQFVLGQLGHLGVVMTPGTPSMIGPTYDMLGVPMPMSPSPFMIPDMGTFLAMNHPMYQQQLRRAHVQPHPPMETSPPAAPITSV